MELRTVTLTDAEIMFAATIGLRRELEARNSGRRNRYEYGGEPFAWGKHVVGALAEKAFAKALGLNWCAGVNTFRNKSDVEDYEVRWSRDGRLKCRPDEKDGEVLVCVTGAAPVFTVQGWMLAAHAKRQEWLDAPVKNQPPAYFVPASMLYCISTLPVRAGRIEGGLT